MKRSVRELFTVKGLKVPESDYGILEARWGSIEALKAEINDIPLENYDISLRNIPGGDQVE